MVDGKVLNHGATFLMFTCLLFFLIGTGAPNWEKFSETVPGEGSESSHIGLWKSCSKISIDGGGSTSSCSTITNSDICGSGTPKATCNKTKAVRAFALISIFVSAAALACLAMVSAKGSGNLVMPGIALGAVTAFTSLLAWAIFASLSRGGYSYDFCFGLFVAGWVFSIISVGLAAAGRGSSA